MRILLDDLILWLLVLELAFASGLDAQLALVLYSDLVEGAVRFFYDADPFGPILVDGLGSELLVVRVLADARNLRAALVDPLAAVREGLEEVQLLDLRGLLGVRLRIVLLRQASVLQD